MNLTQTLPLDTFPLWFLFISQGIRYPRSHVGLGTYSFRDNIRLSRIPWE